MENMKLQTTDIEPIKIEIDVNIDSPEDIRLLETSKSFIIFIYENILDVLTKAIKLNLKKIDLIEIVNFNYMVELDRNQYKKVLNSILKHYESIEDYDKCMDIASLISKCDNKTK